MPPVTRRRKLTIAAGAAGATLLVAGLGAAGAVAASHMLSPSEESKAVIDDAASQLGIEPSELSEALKQALKNRVDEAAEAGRITKEQADELKERIDADEYPLLFGRRGPGFGGRQVHMDVLSNAASYLGLTEAELRDELQSKTLAEVAKSQGKSVDGLVQQLVAAQTERIDEAVEDGRLTDEQATELGADLRKHMEALVNGELHGPGDGQRPRFWPGSGSPRAPPLFGGPPA